MKNQKETYTIAVCATELTKRGGQSRDRGLHGRVHLFPELANAETHCVTEGGGGGKLGSEVRDGALQVDHFLGVCKVRELHFLLVPEYRVRALFMLHCLGGVPGVDIGKVQVVALDEGADFLLRVDLCDFQLASRVVELAAQGTVGLHG